MTNRRSGRKAREWWLHFYGGRSLDTSLTALGGDTCSNKDCRVIRVREVLPRRRRKKEKP